MKYLVILMQEENAENTRYFFQLPARLPLPKQSSTATGKEKVGSSRSSNSTRTLELGDLKKLPGGCMGKLLIYKSGAIKLRLGDTLYDVSNVVTVLCCFEIRPCDILWFSFGAVAGIFRFKLQFSSTRCGNQH